MPAVPHIQVGITNVLQTTGTGLLYRDGSGLVQKLGEYDGSVLTLPRSRVLSNLVASDFGYRLHETHGRSTDYSTWNIGHSTYLEWEPSAEPGPNQGRGSTVTIDVPATCDKNIAYLLGQTVDVYHRGTGNIPTIAVGHSAGLNLWGTGTTAAAEANYARITVSQGVLTSGKTVRIGAPQLFNGGTIGTLYQLYIESPVVAGVTTKYGIYAESAPHYIAGQTTFNATTGNPLTVQAGGVDALVIDASKNATFSGAVKQAGSTSGTLTHAVPATITPYTLTWPAASANGFVKNTSGTISFDPSIGAKGYFSGETTDVISANAVTVDFSAANLHYVDYSSQNVNCTINLTAPSGPCSVTILVKCGGSGAVTWTPSAGILIWSGGSAPDLSTAGVLKIVGFRYNGTYWLGGVSDTFTIPV